LQLEDVVPCFAELPDYPLLFGLLRFGLGFDLEMFVDTTEGR